MLNFEFIPKISTYYLVLLIFFFTLSAMIIINLPIGIAIKLLGLLSVFIYCGHMLFRFGLFFSPHSIRGLKRDSQGKWLLYTHKHTYEAELLGDSTVTSFVSVLRFRIPQSYWPKSCVIFRDSLPLDHYRKLLVVLRMY